MSGKMATLVSTEELEELYSAVRDLSAAVRNHATTIEEAVKAEREACAQIADDYVTYHLGRRLGAEVAERIRARGA